MSLVAYENSDESDEDCVVCEPDPVVIKKLQKSCLKDEGGIGPEVARLLANFEDDTPCDPSSLFNSLPPPKPSSMSELNVVREVKLGSKRTQISIPRLEAAEEEPPKPKKVKQSTKGSGLFSILPPPKNRSAKEANRALLPNVLRKPSKPVEKDILLDDDDDEDDGKDFGDFFNVAKVSRGEKFKVTRLTPKVNINPPVIDLEPEVPVTVEVSKISNTPDVIPCGTQDLQLDEQAMKALVGGKKSRQKESASLIDLSADDVMPDAKHWLLKQLTEEKKADPTQSNKKEDEPSSISKKKHQITYLAHQAKEQELELQNQWAQNRMNRKQTQSKYGF